MRVILTGVWRCKLNSRDNDKNYLEVGADIYIYIYIGERKQYQIL
jgi:hypothetical protein